MIEEPSPEDVVNTLRLQLEQVQGELKNTLQRNNDQLLSALEVIAIQAEMITNANRQIKDLQSANNEYWKRIAKQGL